MITTVWYIVNPISGTRDKSTIVSLIDQYMAPEKFKYEILYTEHRGHAAELTKDAIEQGIDIVVAVGGDGTVNEIARTLVGSETALGIIPCGSGNGLARHLALPMNAEGALRIISERTIHKLDYCTINSQPFFCTAGVGFDASLSDKFAKAGRRGLITYVENALKVGLSYHPETYQLEIEGMNGVPGTTLLEKKAFLITCANASQYGNDFYIAPHASMQDGLMDVTILEPFNILETGIIAFQMVNKIIHHNAHCTYFKCQALKIHRTAPGVIHYDGDPKEDGKDIEVRIVPRNINIVINSQKHSATNKKSIPLDVLSKLKGKA